MTNVTHLDTSNLKNAAITLDSVMSEMEDWRSNKTNRGNRIPDELWRKIIYLAEKHSLSKIRALFGVSKDQYDTKYNELGSMNAVTKETASPEVEFREVKTKRDPHPAATERYHMPDLPATNTVVVELFRGDGKLMKIHMTTHRFKELLQAFYEEL